MICKVDSIDKDVPLIDQLIFYPVHRPAEDLEKRWDRIIAHRARKIQKTWDKQTEKIRRMGTVHESSLETAVIDTSGMGRTQGYNE